MIARLSAPTGFAVRQHRDLVEPELRALASRHSRLVSPPERTAGDEFQLATRDAATALEIALGLVRSGRWSVGLGVGDVDTPIGTSVRAMSGGAFVAAREAVDTAKKRSARFALVATEEAHLDPLVRLLLSLRERRTPEGWELADLLEAEPGLTLTDAAERLGISAQAASQRAQTAGIRLDAQARDAITALLADVDARIGG